MKQLTNEEKDVLMKDSEMRNLVMLMHLYCLGSKELEKTKKRIEERKMELLSE